MFSLVPIIIEGLFSYIQVRNATAEDTTSTLTRGGRYDGATRYSHYYMDAAAEIGRGLV